MTLLSASALGSLPETGDSCSGQWEQHLDVGLNPSLTLSQSLLINKIRMIIARILLEKGKKHTYHGV